MGSEVPQDCNKKNFFQLGVKDRPWPSWLETITNLSHLLTTLNSSATFFIYFAKHYQSILTWCRFCETPFRPINISSQVLANKTFIQNYNP
jgi:hypothetical protein